MAVRFSPKDLFAAAERGDFHAAAAFYHEDAVAYDPAYEEPLRGRDAIRKDITDTMDAVADATLTVGEVLESGDTVAFEVTLRGMQKEALPGTSSEIPSSGQPIELRVGCFARVGDDGLVIEERRYYDVAGLMQQMGMMEG